MTPERVTIGNDLRDAGVAALQSGDAATARRCFESMIASGNADAAAFVALAMACRQLGDSAATAAAIDQALAVDPQNLHALIMKGDDLALAGNPRAATLFYGVAVAVAAARDTGMPPSLAQAVQRAGMSRDRINADIEKHVRESLARFGYDEKRSSARFSQSLALLTGKKQPYIQQPRAYYFPELPQIQFFPRAKFPWLNAVEAATDAICSELEQILQRPEAFVPYLQSVPNTPTRPDAALVNSLDWSAFFLWKNGAVLEENAARCPRTMVALEQVPLTRIKGRAPSILFSLLKPGTRIAPHTGFINARLICHLPLIVPPRCGFRVGNEVREWVKGTAWVFDDTIEHEAWNDSDQTRVVLIFDVWRPELTSEERGLIEALMGAVDSYGGAPPADWSA